MTFPAGESYWCNLLSVHSVRVTHESVRKKLQKSDLTANDRRMINQTFVWKELSLASLNLWTRFARFFKSWFLAIYTGTYWWCFGHCHDRNCCRWLCCCSLTSWLLCWPSCCETRWVSCRLYKPKSRWLWLWSRRRGGWKWCWFQKTSQVTKPLTG